MKKTQSLTEKVVVFLKKCDEHKFFGKYTLLDIIYSAITVYFLRALYLMSKQLMPTIDSQLKANFLLAGFVLLSVIWIFDMSKEYFFERLGKDQKRWICWTLYLIISTLVLGHVFIDTKFNNNEIRFELREYYNDTGTVKGNITCVPNGGKYLMYEDMILCRPQPALYNGTSEVIFHLRNGTKIKKIPRGSLAFRTPKETISIEFQLRGVDQNQNNHYFVVARGVDFINPEDKEKYEDRLITLYIWLIGVMFLIPTMMNNLKNLWK